MLSEVKMRVCIVGNSHVAALKSAWSELSESYRGITIDFFAGRGSSLKYLGVDGEKIYPKVDGVKKSFEFTSGGKSCIYPDQYDIFLVYGVGAKAFFVNPTKNYSAAVIDAAAKDHVKDTLSFRILKNIRSITDKKIFVGHDPLPAFKGEIEKPVARIYLSGLSVVNALVYGEVNAELVAQPEDTIVNNRFTKSDYSKGSKRLAAGAKNDNEEHSEADNMHMNERFGEKWLLNFFSVIKAR